MSHIADTDSIIEHLTSQLSATAVERDKNGGLAFDEIELLRDSGLLSLIISHEYGGQGQPWSAALDVVRRLARSDGSLAHLYGYHFLNQVVARISGTEQQFAELQRQTVIHRWFWGNANNSLDKRVTGRQESGGFRLNGQKNFTSGSPYADRLLISFRREDHPDTIVRAVIDPASPGLHIHNDWDCIGQRQTGSGTVSYQDVFVDQKDILTIDSSESTLPFNTLGPVLAQLILTHVFLGSAEGALSSAAEYTREQSRPWYTSGVDQAQDDRLIQRRYGEFAAQLEAFSSLAARATDEFDQAFARGVSLSDVQRGKTAYSVAAANVFGGKVALEICGGIFEVMGARATASRYGFDRFWRNVRTHTLHNPAEYKLLTLGRYALTGQLPEPGFYS